MLRETITVTRREHLRMQALSRVLDGVLTDREAARPMGLSTRHTNGWWRRSAVLASPLSLMATAAHAVDADPAVQEAEAPREGTRPPRTTTGAPPLRDRRGNAA